MTRCLTNGLRGLLTALSLLFTLAPGAQAVEKITYYHFDALGSPVAATDEAGYLVWQENYHPYGERIKKEPSAAYNTRWYTGHPQDPDTGLLYMGARYYDPVIGRFYAVDPVSFRENDLHSFNRYAYANNNPYRYTDPDGRAPLDERWRRAAGLGWGDAGYGPMGGGPGAGRFQFRGNYEAKLEAERAAGQRLERALLDTRSQTRSQALDVAKEANHIPRSTSPDRVLKPNTKEGREAGLDHRNVRQYEYTNSHGERISIREDRATTYGDGGSQPPHFNAGPSGGDLRQHHYWQEP